jgi:hypothetical protein
LAAISSKFAHRNNKTELGYTYNKCINGIAVRYSHQEAHNSEFNNDGKVCPKCCGLELLALSKSKMGFWKTPVEQD